MSVLKQNRRCNTWKTEFSKLEQGIQMKSGLKETCFYFDGSIKFYTIIEYYPGTDTTKKKTSYRADNTIFIIEDYDTNGNGVKTSYYDEDEELTDYLICEFDSNGHITKQTMYDADGNIKK